MKPCYVLITPAKDEAATIELTIKSVLSQTRLPKEWVIVSDRSIDATDDIVRRYESEYPFIRLVRLEHKSRRSFASVVHAFNVGLNSLRSSDYDFIGFVDADVRFGPDYYQTLMDRFMTDPRLGLAGGLVIDVVNGKLRPGRQYLKDVAGATQFFRRSCFDSLGGLVCLPEGGWDAITCYEARYNGYDTATFSDLVVEHHKPRNSSEGNMIRRNWQHGVRDYAWGCHPVFELGKCVSRLAESPLVIGATLRFLGFSWSMLRRRKRVLSAQLVNIVRSEQLGRIFRKF